MRDKVKHATFLSFVVSVLKKKVRNNLTMHAHDHGEQNETSCSFRKKATEDTVIMSTRINQKSFFLVDQNK